MTKQILRALSSLRLTVILLVMAMILVYAGTWAQVDTSIWAVQKQYFHSFFTWIDFQVMLPRPQAGQEEIPGGFPMLGGYSLGILFLINLLASYACRFTYSWKKFGSILIHLGVILLFVGEAITSVSTVESQMVLEEGKTSNYSQDLHRLELAVMDASAGNQDRVTAIPGTWLEKAGTIRNGRLPFDIEVVKYFPNSEILGPVQAGDRANPLANAGEGVGLTVVERAVAGGAQNQMDAPSAYLTLSAKGKTLGTYLVSLYFDSPQRVRVEGKSYLIQLRQKRYYKPYTLELIKFSHDRYTGTEMARNFSSRVRLVDPARHEDREVLIWMNHPLRYEGETYYQASYRGEHTSVLQVVRNPGWVMPYIACVIGAVGMLIHFGMHLIGFISGWAKKKETLPVGTSGLATGYSKGAAWFPAVVLSLCLIYLASLFMPAQQSGGYDLRAFGKLPISFDGRVQPLDSVARNSLRIINGKDTLSLGGKSMGATEWLADVLGRPEKASEYPIFRIDHPDVLGLLKLDGKRTRFSAREVLASGTALDKQVQQAGEVESRDQNAYQKKILELGDHVRLYLRLTDLGELYLSPPLSAKEDWQSVTQAMQDSQKTGQINPGAKLFLTALGDYHENHPDQFNKNVASYENLLAKVMPDTWRQVRFEALFNRVEPFIQCMALYVLVFILAALAWLGWTRPLLRAAFWVLILGLVVHTLGLAARIYIQGRPPVTNLYSSAIFIGWGAAILAAGIERFYRNGIGSISAAVVGLLSLIVAQNLSGDGDTMRKLQAVLDSNFWLTTHVLSITLGYSAAFLAGILGIIFVLVGVLTKELTAEFRRSLSRMIYGTACFAMLFSFVGTILGGIWADQSWGRFWGWDPKENGAVLIVIWLAIMLHAHWGRMVGDRGLALLAIGGNIVTSWSWFGTNMLGVGLHSYGFMDAALKWLLIFVCTQLAMIWLGLWPLARWRSDMVGKDAFEEEGETTGPKREFKS